MNLSAAPDDSAESESHLDYDAIIIGAGVAGLIQYSGEQRLTRVVVTKQGLKDWTNHVLDLGKDLLMNEIRYWMTGVNKNVERKQTPRIMRYSGGYPAFRQHCDAIAAEGYKSLAWSRFSDTHTN